MNTIRLSIAILIILALLGFAFPIVSHADTSNQSQLISLLKQLIVVLEAQLQQIILQMQAQQNVQPAANPPQTPTSPQTPAATVTLAPAPTCTLTANPTSIIAGKSSTLTWTSSNATAASISPLGSTLLSSAQSVSPSYTTLYFGIFTGPGGRAVCSAIVGVGAAAAATQNPAAGTAGGTAASSGGTGGSCVYNGQTFVGGQEVPVVSACDNSAAHVMPCYQAFVCRNGQLTPLTASQSTGVSCVASIGTIIARSGETVLLSNCAIACPTGYESSCRSQMACSNSYPYTCQNGQWVPTTNTTTGGSYFCWAGPSGYWSSTPCPSGGVVRSTTGSSCPLGITVAGGACAYTTTTSSCTTEGQQTYLKCPPASACVADPGWFTCRGGQYVRECTGMACYQPNSAPTVGQCPSGSVMCGVGPAMMCVGPTDRWYQTCLQYGSTPTM